MKLKTLFAIVAWSAIYIPCLGMATNIADPRRPDNMDWPMEGVLKFATGISNLHEHPFRYGCILIAIALGGICVELVVFAIYLGVRATIEEWWKSRKRSKPDASPSLPSV